jgi:hypothetical protein
MMVAHRDSQDFPGPESRPREVLDAAAAHALLDDCDARPEQLLEAFATTGLDPLLRDQTLRHPRLTYEDLTTAMRYWPASLKERAMSVIDDVRILRDWATSPVPYERAVVAMNPHCPEAFAEELARDPHRGVRANAACAPALSRHSRARLALEDPDPEVRAFVHWLLTTPDGRKLTAGERYVSEEPWAGFPPGEQIRIITYEMPGTAIPPV